MKGLRGKQAKYSAADHLLFHAVARDQIIEHRLVQKLCKGATDICAIIPRNLGLQWGQARDCYPNSCSDRLACKRLGRKAGKRYVVDCNAKTFGSGWPENGGHTDFLSRGAAVLKSRFSIEGSVKLPIAMWRDLRIAL